MSRSAAQPEPTLTEALLAIREIKQTIIQHGYETNDYTGCRAILDKYAADMRRWRIELETNDPEAEFRGSDPEMVRQAIHALLLFEAELTADLSEMPN